MMREEKQQICDNIFEYITKELDEFIDNDILIQTSMERLGELYYNRILSVIDNSNIELVNTVIRAVAPKNCELDNQEGYYRAICKIMGITRKPADMLVDVEKEYNELFVQKYSSVMQKYQVELAQINGKLYQAKLASDAIKDAPASYSFMRDISTDADIGTTMNIYTDATKDFEKKGMEKFDEYINGVSTNYGSLVVPVSRG